MNKRFRILENKNKVFYIQLQYKLLITAQNRVQKYIDHVQFDGTKVVNIWQHNT